MTEFTLEELEKEIWKDIPDYEGIYQVSDLGRVKSLSREKLIRGKYPFIFEERILNPGINGGGYYTVGLYKNRKRKTRQIHQWVAIAFLNHVPCGNLIEVNHKDENIKNNRLINLEILTHEEHLDFTHRNASSQYRGVIFDKNLNKWQSYIKINGQQKHLGSFATEIEAHEARKKAEEMAKNGDFSFMKPKEYSSQYTGVSFHKRKNKWMAYIKINGQRKHLGLFLTELEAHEAYQKAEEMAKNGDFSFMNPKEYSSKHKGVSFHKPTNKWRARLTINGKSKHLGSFLTELEAHETYQKALKELNQTY